MTKKDIANCLPKSVNSRLILEFRNFSDLFFADTMCQAIEKEVSKVLERDHKMKKELLKAHLKPHFKS